MSMEAANQIIDTLIRAKHHKTTSVSSGLSGPTLRPSGASRGSQDKPAMSYPQRPGESPYGVPPRQPSAEAVSAANNSYPPPQSPTAAARQPMPPRTSSSNAAVAAAAAATGMTPPQQTPGRFHCFSPVV